MRRFVNRIFILGCIIFFVCSCFAQKKSEVFAKIDRPPAVAGSFYPGYKTELIDMLESCFNASEKTLSDRPLAVIVPHAGYVFSGSVAAAAYKQIERNTKLKHVFIIGSSHTMYFNGVSVYSEGDFITPLGKVPVDTLTSWLAEKYDFISADFRPHQNEHSLEVQLPFLQYWLKHPFSIIPIILGGGSRQTCRQLADALAPFFNDNNLFVISTDFSHYPSYSEATASDRSMADAIISNSSKKFLDTKSRLESKGIPNLMTAACGWTSILTLLYITEKIPEITYHKIMYQNSGDSDYGEKNRVVGYNAICAIKKTGSNAGVGFNLSDDLKIQLLQLARKTMVDFIDHNSVTEIEKSKISDEFKVKAGAFVTLKKDGKLRGCVGRILSDKPLYQTIQSMSIAAALWDHRFPPVSKEEIPELEIEISVLTPLKKIHSIEEIEMGKHGIYIKQGNRSGTFLPQVAHETGWTKEEFLGHCAQDKALIGWEGWKNADIFIYEALIFIEREFHEIIQ